MKKISALLLASALLALSLQAEEKPEAPSTPAVPTTPKFTTDLTPAKDVPPPKPAQTLDLMPAQDVPPASASAPEPALIPEVPETMPKPPGSAIEEPKTGGGKDSKKEKKEKKNTTEAAANEMASRVRFREVKTRAVTDPAVQAEWQHAERARTDFERREAMKSYYKLLYGRMLKIDGSLKNEIATRQAASVRRLTQSRLEATEAPEANTDLRAARGPLE